MKILAWTAGLISALAFNYAVHMPTWACFFTGAAFPLACLLLVDVTFYE